ncbi:hypothetical protein Cgig2_000543 [Carnegiea gigantea]|uniref:Zinc finger (C2H2 type) family protein n=1 Tax=Carnegiea gigantea TaxID=171969 RepID=A0A9Q1GL33_9CARY|nr:hypothetical protein Cgig2_000543 [Carnegiea gigantea]
MAATSSRFIKSLQCKSTSFHDVYLLKPKRLLPCRNNTLHDVIQTPKSKPIIPDSDPHAHNKRTHHKTPPTPLPRRCEPVGSKPDPTSTTRVRRTLPAPTNPRPDLPFFPSVSDLPEGHPSRNVVEIIFHTRWGPKPFSGRVEMVLKIQNPAQDVTLFEEYRDSVKARASSCDGGRCSADGNEMMRFRCLGAAASGGDCGGFFSTAAGKGVTACTYSGSGRAHECAGGGRGRRAMLVCRVIAGRVKKRVGLHELMHGSARSEFDSVKGDDGELAVFDSRAYLSTISSLGTIHP